MEFLKFGLSPILTFIVGFLVYQSNSSIDKLSIDLENQKVDLIKLEQYQKFNFEVFEAVKKSLESGKTEQQEVAIALVVSMPIDTTLKLGLLDVLNKSSRTSDVVKKKVLEEKFTIEEKAVNRYVKKDQLHSYKDYNIDIFYIEDCGESSKEIATETQTVMNRDNFTGRLRIRNLPDIINEKSGFRIHTPQIRYNEWEAENAADLKKYLESKFQITFELQLISQKTYNYLSVFICA